MGKTYKDLKYRKKGGLMPSRPHKCKRMCKEKHKKGKCDE